MKNRPNSCSGLTIVCWERSRVLRTPEEVLGVQEHQVVHLPVLHHHVLLTTSCAAKVADALACIFHRRHSSLSSHQGELSELQEQLAVENRSCSSAHPRCAFSVPGTRHAGPTSQGDQPSEPRALGRASSAPRGHWPSCAAPVLVLQHQDCSAQALLCATPKQRCGGHNSLAAAGCLLSCSSFFCMPRRQILKRFAELAVHGEPAETKVML